MSTITTKYSVGDKVYIVTTSVMSNKYQVELREITKIQVGGKAWEQYSLGHLTTRAERDIYTDLETAKEIARIKAREAYEKNLEQINETQLRSTEVAEG